ncbi:MAG: acetate--CoA ligase family protein [Candidatus Aenigmatarchaeota archaeon]|nr:acetate--CoA ligase family protein [Candidatus Aenigmarchaeota archaeon]
MNLRRIMQLKQTKNLTEKEAKDILAAYKIPIAKGEVCTSFEQLKKTALWMGFPLVLKAVSEEVVHKTDVGAVVLDIKDEKSLEEAYISIIGNMKKINVYPQGFYIQEMVKGDFELIVGAKRDNTFGPVIMVGLGGIYAEALKDIVFRIAPVDRKTALEMIGELKSSKIFKGFRGKKANVELIADVLVKLSRIMIENPEISEVDINPLIVDSSKAIATDARMVLV